MRIVKWKEEAMKQAGATGTLKIQLASKRWINSVLNL